MNKVLRALLLAVLAVALAAPMAVSAQNPLLTVSGKVFNGTNGGPEVPVTIRLYRDTGGGDVLIREETFPGRRVDEDAPYNPDEVADPDDPEWWDNTFSERGDFLFQMNCVRGLYTLEIDAFTEGGASAVDVGWYAGWDSNREILLKKGAGAPGPWTYSFYADCSNLPEGWGTWGDLTFVYSSVAGPRQNAAWMYLAGRMWDPTIPKSMKYDACGNPKFNKLDVDPMQAVEGAAIWVAKIGYDQNTNVANPAVVVENYGTAQTGDKGFWGMGLVREPGFYKIEVVGIPGPQPVLVSANPLYFQVFDVAGTGTDGYGPGSSWLPWSFTQTEWVYDNLNFVAIGTWAPAPWNPTPCVQ